MLRRVVLAAIGAFLATAPISVWAEDGWSFTDDRGVTITLPQRPLRIAASYPVFTALWDYGVHPTGLIAHRKPEQLPGLEQAGVDMSGVTVLKDAVDGWNIEAVLAAEPDIIITQVSANGTIWGIGDDTEMQARLEAIAPILALRGDLPVVEGIARHAELAQALGADPQDQAGEQQFAAISQSIREAAALAPDLKLLVVVAGDDSLFTVSTGPSFPDLAHLVELGVNIVDGGNQDLSWEQASGLVADALVTDDRYGMPEIANPVWQRLPAVASGQVYPVWRYQPAYSYAGYARAYAGFLDVLKSARVVTD